MHPAVTLYFILGQVLHISFSWPSSNTVSILYFEIQQLTINFTGIYIQAYIPSTVSGRTLLPYLSQVQERHAFLAHGHNSLLIASLYVQIFPINIKLQSPVVVSGLMTSSLLLTSLLICFPYFSSGNLYISLQNYLHLLLEKLKM